MALPTFVANGAFSSSTGAITPALPAGLATNDLLLLFLETHQETATVPTPNGGTWTEAPSSPQGSGTVGANSSSRCTVFYSIYNGTQGAPTTNDPGDHISGRISAFRGVSTAAPFDTSSGGSGNAVSTANVATIPGSTTTVADCLIVVPITSEDDSDTFTLLANASLATITLRFDNTHTAGDEGHIAMWTGTKVAAGAYGSSTTTVGGGGASQRYGGLTLALQPTAGTSVAAWIQDDMG